MSETDVIRAELRAMRKDVSEIKGALSKVADAVERLTRLEERYSALTAALERAFSSISKIEGRLSTLEIAQPVQKLASSWVTNGVWMVAGAAVMFVLKHVGVM